MSKEHDIIELLGGGESAFLEGEEVLELSIASVEGLGELFDPGEIVGGRDEAAARSGEERAAHGKAGAVALGEEESIAIGEGRGNVVEGGGDERIDACFGRAEGRELFLAGDLNHFIAREGL